MPESSTSVTEETETESHEVSAFYSLQPDGTPYGKHMPVLDCSCGFWTRQCDSWEDAGVEIDRHLEEVRV